MSADATWPDTLARFAVIGHSNAGKTTLVTQIVRTLRARGLRVGTVKHASHTLDLDTEGKDSWRHGQAGADRVLLVGADTAVGFVHRGGTSELAGWGRFFADAVDIVIVEGFKRTPMPHVWLEATDVAQASLEPVADALESAHPAWRLRRPQGPLDRDVGLPLALVERLADSAASLVRRPTES